MFQTDLITLRQINSNKIDCSNGDKLNIPADSEVCVSQVQQQQQQFGNNNNNQLTQQNVNGFNLLVRQNFNQNQIPGQNNPLNIDFSQCTKTVQVQNNQNSCDFIGGSFRVDLVTLSNFNGKKFDCSNGRLFNIPVNSEVCVAQGNGRQRRAQQLANGNNNNINNQGLVGQQIFGENVLVRNNNQVPKVGLSDEW